MQLDSDGRIAWVTSESCQWPSHPDFSWAIQLFPQFIRLLWAESKVIFHFVLVLSADYL